MRPSVVSMYPGVLRGSISRRPSLATVSHTAEGWPESRPAYRPSSSRVQSLSTGGAGPTRSLARVHSSSRSSIRLDQCSSHSSAERALSSDVESTIICQKVTAWSPSPALNSGALSTRAMLSCGSQLSDGVVVISGDARRLASAGWRGRAALRTRRRTHERENWLAAAGGARLATTGIMVVACDVFVALDRSGARKFGSSRWGKNQGTIMR
eukprot:scaffold38258_cov67-Phaeocystis_antarctica.AAC.2